mmetsp:Transcript_26472/g.61498  ORF Transcript_26472/g.61498 Transcript_26472/m.61498 type:complete len:95 (-) Transcript_26472:54-338(-)
MARLLACSFFASGQVSLLTTRLSENENFWSGGQSFQVEKVVTLWLKHPVGEGFSQECDGKRYRIEMDRICSRPFWSCRPKWLGHLQIWPSFPMF